MRGGLRHRRTGHAGIPHGPTMNFGSTLSICYLWNQGISSSVESVTDEAGEAGEFTVVSRWNDQGPNDNYASQTTNEVKPKLSTDNSLEFLNHSDDADYADYMTFTKFRISANTPFMIFLVSSLGSNNTVCYISDAGSELLQYTSGNAHQLKTNTGATNMTHSAVFTNPTSEKHLMCCCRDGSDNIFLFRNGLKCNGHNNSGSTDTGFMDLTNLGVKNLASPSNWFDGRMYDVIVVDGEYSESKRHRIEDYLLKKHGLQRAGLDYA